MAGRRADPPRGLSIVIPCLNEAATVARVVEQGLAAIARAGLPGEVVVADNGSTDGSREAAAAAGARVVRVSTRGYGAALHGGIMAARFRWVTTADADLSYPVDEADRLLGHLREGTADLVLGSRLSGRIERGAMPWLHRRVGTPVLTFLLRLVTGWPISDCNSGMRAIDRRAYETLRLLSPGMEYASEMLIRASERRLRYAEVPISYRKDQRPRPSHLRPLRDGWRHLRYIVLSRLGR